MAQYYEIFNTKGRRFVLRNAEAGDAPAMLHYMACVDRETTFLAREPGEFTYSAEEEAALLSAWKVDSLCRFLIAVTEDGEIAATSHFSYNAKRMRMRHRVEMGVSVRKDFWRLGLGRKLMDTQLIYLKEKGIEKASLMVDSLNFAAISLYLSLGFTVEGTLRNEAKMVDGSYRDIYTMAKFL